MVSVPHKERRDKVIRTSRAHLGMAACRATGSAGINLEVAAHGDTGQDFSMREDQVLGPQGQRHGVGMGASTEGQNQLK